MPLPLEAQPLLSHFTQPTSARFVVLTAAAVLATGWRTVANLLRTVGALTLAMTRATAACCPSPAGPGLRPSTGHQRRVPGSVFPHILRSPAQPRVTRGWFPFARRNPVRYNR